MARTATRYSGRPRTRLKADVLRLKGDVCIICGHPGATELDHLIPEAEGDDARAGYPLQRLPDPDLPIAEVHVGPAEAEQLAARQPERQCYHEQGVEPMSSRYGCAAYRRSRD